MYVRIRTVTGYSAEFENALLETIDGEIRVRRDEQILFPASHENVVYWSTEEEWTTVPEPASQASPLRFVACPTCDSPRVLPDPEPPQWVCPTRRHEFEADGERAVICVVK